jgi:hypothetical protein
MLCVSRTRQGGHHCTVEQVINVRGGVEVQDLMGVFNDNIEDTRTCAEK